MKIVCTTDRCDLEVPLYPVRETLKLNDQTVTVRWVFRGVCEECGQGYVRISPPDKEV